MKPKNIARRLILVLLVVSMMVPLITSVGAYPWNGSGTGGGNATGSAGGDTSYSIAGGNATEMIVGYRFTGLTANGRRANGARSLDVFVTGKEWFLTSGLYHRVRAQYNKYEYVKAFDGTLSIDNGTTTLQTGAVLESTMKFDDKLPSSLNTDSGQIDDELKIWQGDVQGNLNKVAKKIGYTKGTSSMGPNDKIIVEPIFALRVDGVNFCMTASDIAWLGYSEIFDYNKDSNGRKTGMNGKKGTWYWISNYTNLHCPNILFTDKEDGVGGLWKICPSAGLGSTHGTFETLLTYGYGVGLCYNNKVIKPDLSAVDIICEVKSGNDWIRIDPTRIPCGSTYRLKLVYQNARTNSGAGLSTFDNIVYWFGDNTSDSEDLAYSSMTPYTIRYNTMNGTWWEVDTKYPSTQAGQKEAKSILSRDGAMREIYWVGTKNREMTAPSYPDSGSWQIAIWMYNDYKSGDPTSKYWDAVSKRNEFDVTNNRYKVNYGFQHGNTSHDVEITSIRYFNKPIENGGTEYSKDSSGRYLIPYGATVYVYHNYKNNSGFGLYVNGYENTTQRNVLYNGEKDIYLANGGTVSNVLAGTFTANSFTFVSRPGMVYVSGKYSATGETNTGNNKKTVSWKAYVDLELEKIELRSTTNADTILDPNNIPYGSSFTVYYTFKNNSALAVANAATYKKNNFTNALGTYYIAEKGCIDENGKNLSKILVKGDTHTNVTTSGSVSGAICVSGNTSLSYELSETRANNKKTLSYKVVAQKDLAIEFIQYAYNYTNSAGATQTVTQTVYRGTDVAYETQKLPVFPYGVSVYVYAQFANNSNVQIVTDGYYTRGTEAQRAMTYTPTIGGVKYPSATDYSFPANSKTKFCVGNFSATVLGDSKYTVEVYQNNQKTPAGEQNTGNNSQTSNYRVYGDVGIEIYFTDKNNNKVTPAEFWHTQEYKVWITATNYTPISVAVGVKYNDVAIKFDHTGDGKPDMDLLYLGASGTDSAAYSFVVEAPIGSELIEKLGTYSVGGEIYFYSKKSSVGECDVNGNDKTNNNTTTKNFVIKAEVGIADIIYRDEDGNTYSDPAKIKENANVEVYYVCTNAASVDVKVELLYNGVVLVNEAVLPAGTTGTEIYVTEFVATDPGRHEVVGEIYRVVRDESNKNADGELDPDNNIYKSSYDVFFYDIAITDIFYKDEDGTFYGRGDNDQVTLMIGSDYKVYYTIKNYSNVTVYLDIYNNKDATALGVTKLTGGARVTTVDGTSIRINKKGLMLEADAEISILAGTMLSANQQIGVAPVSGSTYLSGTLVAEEERNIHNNILEETVKFVHNVSIEEVYLAQLGTGIRFDNVNNKGQVIVPLTSNHEIHYVLKNHTNKTIKVNVYSYNGSSLVKRTVNGSIIITLQPNEVKDVTLDTQLPVSSMQAGKGYYWEGHVYRDGTEPKADLYESTFSDNSIRCRFTGVLTPYLEFIDPNAPYREGTSVITSYYLYNPTTKAYDGSANATATVHFVVKIKGTDKVVYQTTKSAIVPSLCTTQDRAQLVYFKWYVPENYLEDTDKFEVCADLVISDFPDVCVSHLNNTRPYVLKDAYFTPDTEYEEKQPDGWIRPSYQAIGTLDTKYWTIWDYDAQTGTFVSNKYALRARVNGSLSIKPDDKVQSDYERYPGHWVMKSGYGLQVESLVNSSLYKLNGYLAPTGDMYTGSQYSYMIWPEFLYAVDYNTPTISTLEKVDGKWMLPIFSNGDKVYGRVHFTPLWYPDGSYTVYGCHSDIWTPMGMITVGACDFIEIQGAAYDDWYIGHG